MHRPFLSLALLAWPFALGCQSAVQDPSRQVEATSPKLPIPASPTEEEKQTVSSHFLGKFRPGTFGPRLSLASGRGHAVWAQVTEGEERGFYALPLSTGGTADGPTRFADVSSELTFLELAALPSSETAVLSVSREEEGEVLRAHIISSNGELVSGPHILSGGTGRVLWVQSYQQGDAAVVLVARQQGTLAEVSSVVVRKDGAASAATSLTKQARSWQLASSAEGAFLATVEESSAKRNVLVRRLSARGTVVGAFTEVAKDLKVGLDLDLAVTSDRVVVAYSESGEGRPTIMSATLDHQGHIKAPASRLTPPRGEQSLVRLLAVGRDVAAIWEEPRHGRVGHRELFVGYLNEQGRSTFPEYRLSVEGHGPLLPQLQATQKGVVAVTMVPNCSEPGDCDRAGAAWAFLEEEIAPPVGGDVWLLKTPLERPAMTWDLSCDGDFCHALMADHSSSPEVVFAELQLTGAKPARAARQSVRGQRLVLEESLAPVLPLADLTGVRTSTGSLLAWVSFFDPSIPYERPQRPAPDGRMAPVRALLHTQSMRDSRLEAVASVTDEIISYRARSLGGVALTEPQGGRSILAWAALDGDQPQLFVTLVDETGKRLRQRMLTHSKGEVTDVCAVSVGERTVVVWVDSRTGTAQIRGLVVDQELRTVGREVVLVSDARAPTDLSVLALEQGVRLTYGEEAASGAQADLRSVLLDPEQLKAGVLVVDLESSPLHSHSPAYLRRQDESAVAAFGYIEQGATEGGEPQASLKLVPLGPAGLPSGEGVTIPFPGLVRGFSGECTKEACRVAALVSSSERGELWAVLVDRAVVQGERQALPFFLSQQEGHPVQTAPPLVLGGEVFVENQSVGGEWELSRIVVDW